MRPTDEKFTFDTLNGLRGIAAFAVVNSHLRFYFAGYHSQNVGLVVDFFFVLSGFVLAHAYGDRLKSEYGAARFMAARVLRLYPMYFVGLVIGAVDAWINFRWAGNTHYFVTVGAGLLFLPPPPSLSSNAYNLFPLDFPAWSLFYELIANLAFALFARRLNNVVLGAVIAISFVGLVVAGLSNGTLDLGVRPEGWAGGLARVMFSFFAGIALYRLWRARPANMNLHPVLLFVLLVLPLLYMPQGQAEWMYDLAVISVYFPALVFLGAQSRPARAWIAICAVLGAISYPLYAIHATILDALQVYLDKPLTAAAPWSGLAIMLGLGLMCWWLDIKVDLPLRRRVGRSRLFQWGERAPADNSTPGPVPAYQSAPKK